MRKLLFAAGFLALAASACSGWTVQPLPLPGYTPPATRTPSVFTATPIVLPAPITATGTIFSTHTPLGNPQPGVVTFTPSITPSRVISASLTATAPGITAFDLVILSCNTSIDISHGMGEVTNAYVQIRNTGTTELTEVCATLRGLDEARLHPDKTRCVASLPAGFLVTLKLTVDTGYRQDTPIQVDVSTGAGLTRRAGKESCTDIGVFVSEPPNLGTSQPIP